jgi:15-cis-phytoene desaturase
LEALLKWMSTNLEYDIVIVGAGLSGLSAGYYSLPKNILILEGRSEVGGRTSSWNDNGMLVESGLHRMLGFYDELPKLMEKSGIKLDKAIIWEDEIEIKLPEISAAFGLSLWKPLFSLKTALGNNNFISPIEKIKLMKFLISGFVDLEKRENFDSITVYTYAKEKGLSDKIIFRVLTPLTEGLFFIPPDKYSSYNFFQLFKPYLGKIYKSRAGAFSGGMTEVMCDPIKEKIKKEGGEVLLNTPVSKIQIEDKKVKGVVIKNKLIKSENVIIATSLADSQRLIKNSSNNQKDFSDFLQIKSMPSVTFQLELKERSLPNDRATFSPGTIFASYSEQSKTTFRHVPGRLSIILSTPEKYLDKSREEILKIVLEDAKKLKINLKKENIINYRKITWKEDFYSYEPGNVKFIPKTTTEIKGLFFAGDYTKQKHLQTMEGAVVSGKLAAAAV